MRVPVIIATGVVVLLYGIGCSSHSEQKPAEHESAKPSAAEHTPEKSEPAPHGVNLRAYNRIHNGMTMKEVEDMFGQTGDVTAGAGISIGSSNNDDVTKTYTGENDLQKAIISYANGRVNGKSEIGLK
ncbi:MAG TPA: hypothetical protein VFJ29_03145 [Candidatus Kapabacteria bacterium]|nr:hypothetical protein [Candidatus Kapabacteria bacterium]